VASKKSKSKRSLAQAVYQEQQSNKIYVVRRGDTLIDIAKKHQVTLRKLASVNGIRSKSKIMVGKALIIPD
jgi:LysM repeat protein